ncbi:hypothetical protein IKE84_00110 [Candidatus Saccharibacteria bacterium]|nr:hypothetical protein [Candidatus Saccharibacteria bacterium]
MSNADHLKIAEKIKSQELQRKESIQLGILVAFMLAIILGVVIILMIYGHDLTSTVQEPKEPEVVEVSSNHSDEIDFEKPVVRLQAGVAEVF